MTFLLTGFMNTGINFLTCFKLSQTPKTEPEGGIMKKGMISLSFLCKNFAHPHFPDRIPISFLILFHLTATNIKVLNEILHLRNSVLAFWLLNDCLGPEVTVFVCKNRVISWDLQAWLASWIHKLYESITKLLSPALTETDKVGVWNFWKAQFSSKNSCIVN